MGIVSRVFGPSRAEIWRKLSAEVGGRFVKGGFLQHDRVEVDHAAWTVTLDSYVVPANNVMIPFTRMRAPFASRGGFRFAIYRKSVFSGIAKALGMQDIEVGDPPFDRDFIIKGTNETLVRQLLANEHLRELIASQPDIKLSIEDDEGWFGARFPGGVDELNFVVRGTITDIDRLKHLYELFAETLDTLCRLGEASSETPPIKLT